MNYKIYLNIFIALLFNYSLYSQPFYRSPENSQYWKNRKPYEGYWQQDVHYQIKASIDETTDIVTATEKLTYYNNSPHDLTVVYFNLFNNAYQKDSYLDKLHEVNKTKTSYGKYGSEKLGTVIEDIKYKGKAVKTELDNTVMAVYLNEPIKAGESAVFEISFKTYFDLTTTVRNRMKAFSSSGYRHYDGVHWYPRICVYDRKFGWFNDQHLGREFYGDFGTYEVELTFANDYIVEATGNLLNQDEVLPKDLRQKLDISNFKTPLTGPVSVIVPRDGSKKTWKYYAENVHDFAFTADPTYRIGEVEWKGIKCISVAQESNAYRWQNAASYTAKIIETYSTDFGMYIWPKIIVADARDGMEYPMLTLDGGGDPDYRGLLAHEVGHQWFYGMIGNNETYRAALDEGFTQFITSWALERIDGKHATELPSKSAYVRKHKKPTVVREQSVYHSYFQDAIAANDPTLNTHSDDFGSALRQGGGYRHVYSKTATMLYNLQYVLGDKLFNDAMKNYFNEWKVCHPYFEDFRNSIIMFTKVDLNWFFDQWMETSKEIDYDVDCVKKGKEKDQYKIKFERKGRMQMPLDFEVTAKNDSVYKFLIPNNWFVKQTKSTVLPKWIGWGKLNPKYTAIVTVPGGIKNVQIDPSYRLADVNQLNNSKKCPTKISFDHQIWNLPDRKNYHLFWRPDVWYNSYDGFKTGLHLNGNYYNYRHVMSFTAWYNTGLVQNNIASDADENKFNKFSYNFSYKTGTDRLLKGSSVSLASRYLDGLQAYMAGMDRKSSSGNDKIYLNFKSLYRHNPQDLKYLLYPGEWNYGLFNNTLNFGLDHKYTYKRGEGLINFNLKSSTLFSDYSFSQLSLTATNKNYIGKLEIRTRTFAQYGTGTNIAPESALFLAGANPEEMMENKFIRSRGFIPDDWTGYGVLTNNFHAGGGLNLRGYAGYLAPEVDKNGNITFTYKGSTGIAENIEIDFSRYVGLGRSFIRNTFKFDSYLFADAGIINENSPSENLAFSDVRVDAGLGTALTIQRWGALQLTQPLTIRFDMPVFLNRTPNADPDYLKFRWVLGVKRSF